MRTPARLTLLNLFAAALVCSPCLAQETPFGDNGIELKASESQPEMPPEQFQVVFAAGDKLPQMAPNFSPKGTQFELASKEVANLPGIQHLVGRINLGPDSAMPEGITIAFSRNQAELPYDQLFVDTNLNGDLSDEKPVIASPKLTRDKWWSSFDSVTLKVRHSDQPGHVSDYPVSFWIVVETPEEQPVVARFSRKGFLQGRFTRGDQIYHVAITDGNNDAVFGVRDSWAISATGNEGKPEKPLWRTISDFTWAGEQAWKLTLDATDGSSAVVSTYDAGISRSDDETMRDHLRADRMAARAESPLEFEHDYEAAIKLATESGKPCFIKFETDWCGPCKTMHQLVFTAKDVVDASQGIVCVTVDGDKRKDLTEKYNVGSYPTGIFIDKTQTETTRFSGYRSVKEMTEVFQKIAR